MSTTKRGQKTRVAEVIRGSSEDSDFEKLGSIPDWESEETLKRPRFFHHLLAGPGSVDKLKQSLIEIHETSVSDSKEKMPWLSEGSHSAHAFQYIISQLHKYSRSRESLDLALWAYHSVTKLQLQSLLHLSSRREARSDPSAHAADVIACRRHKGHLLMEVVLACDELGWNFHRNYFLILTLVEDILTYLFLRSPQLNFWDDWALTHRNGRATGAKASHWLVKLQENCGSYSYAARHFGLSPEDLVKWVCRIAEMVFAFCSEGPDDYHNYVDKDRLFPLLGRPAKRTSTWPDMMVMFPEWVAGALGLESHFGVEPASGESRFSAVNLGYYNSLCLLHSQPKSLGCIVHTERNEKQREHHNEYVLEEIARYLFGMVPGVRVQTNLQTKAAQHDVVASIEGNLPDFRGHVRKGFICECKSEGHSFSADSLSRLMDRIQQVGIELGIAFSLTPASRAALEGSKFHRSHGRLFVGFSDDDLGISRRASCLSERAASGFSLSLEELCSLDVAELVFLDMFHRKYDEAKLALYRSTD